MRTSSARIEQKPDFIPAGSKLRPMRDVLIVKPLDVQLNETIISPWNGKTIRGQVVAAGPGEYPNIHEKGQTDGKPYHTIRKSRVFVPTQVKPGDIVELGGMELKGYLFPTVVIGTELHVICTEKDVCGVVNQT
jgi:hypothetical protein